MNLILPVPDKPTPYQEGLLHWIWKSRHFDLSELYTVEGLPLTILDPGIHNHSDGPDFLNANIKIGSIRWFGDVEIHWREQDWNLHRHHKNRGFNQVVLHVVYDAPRNKNKAPVLRQDQTRIPTLHLRPFLKEPLQSFLERFNRPGALPCAGHFSFISQGAFQRQLEKAQEQYFEQKVDDLLHWYDSSLPPSRAWINMLAQALFDGLGIAYNREPMQELCRKLLAYLSKNMSRAELIEQAVTISKINAHSPSGAYKWKHKSCRPANHPSVRIRQAAECLWFMHQLPFEQWLKADSSHLWEQLLAEVQTHPGIGRERAGILFGTVWLPAFFILGNLFGSGRMSTAAYNNWLNHSVQLPHSLLRTFQSLNIPADSYQYNLGTIYQLRSYCTPRKCEECEVFKSVICS